MSKLCAKKPRGHRRPTSSPFTPTESQICQSFLHFVEKRFPEFLPDIIKIDNEGRTSWTEGKRKKAEGKIKGASDYFVAVPNSQYAGLWLEMKAERGKESAAQKEFGQARMKRGYEYRCVYGIDQAMKVFSEYIEG